MLSNEAFWQGLVDDLLIRLFGSPADGVFVDFKYLFVRVFFQKIHLNTEREEDSYVCEIGVQAGYAGSFRTFQFPLGDQRGEERADRTPGVPALQPRTLRPGGAAGLPALPAVAAGQ